MELRSPLSIGARLLPSLKVGSDTLSLEHVGNAGGRMIYRWFLDMEDGREFSESDLKSGMQGAGYQDMFGSLLSFLGAAAEAYRYEMGGRKSDNGDLFPKEVAEWAYQHDDEISMLQIEIEEGAELISE